MIRRNDATGKSANAAYQNYRRRVFIDLDQHDLETVVSTAIRTLLLLSRK